MLLKYLIEKVILGDNTSGLYEYNEGKIEILPGGQFFNGMSCLMIMPYDDNRIIVATYKHGLYLYNYLTGEVLSGFIEPSRKLWGLRIYRRSPFQNSRNIGWVFIFDHEGKLIKNWDKNNSGLMDNGILSFYYDPATNSELWISTIGFISKVYINLPFTEYSPKSGIEGGVDCICDMNGIIYISTDLGVYKSRTNDKGRLEYTKIPEIIDQVFPLYHAKVGVEEFILAGSLNGLFQITSAGKVTKITDNAPNVSALEKKFENNVRIIVQSKINPSRFYIGCNMEGLIVIDYNSGKWTSQKTYKTGQGSIVGIVEEDNGDLIIGSDFSNNVFHAAEKDSTPVLYGIEKGVPESSINSLGIVNNEIVLVTGTGLYKYLKTSDSWIPYNELTGNYSTGKESHKVMQDQDKDLWYAYNDKKFSEMLFKSSEGITIRPLALFHD